MKKQLILAVTTIVIGLLVFGEAFANQSEPPSPKGSSAPPAEMDSAIMPENSMHPPRHKGHKPPPQAYEDCKGKKAGDIVQHTTPEGKVEATCEDSPEGLVARPNNPPQPPPGDSPKQ